MELKECDAWRHYILIEIIKIILVFIWLSLTIFISSTFFSYFYRIKKASRKKIEHKKNLKYKPRVSFIIPTYNEENSILEKLENTLKLKYPGKKLEIFIVDSNSKDNTLKIIRDFIKTNEKENIKLFVEKSREGKSEALNSVLPHCTGEILCVSDANSIIESNALDEAVANFYDKTIGAVTGRLVTSQKNTGNIPLSESSYRNVYDVFRLGESKLYSTFIFSGKLALYRRSLVTKFYEGADDTGIAMDIISKGYAAKYDSDAVAYEPPSPSLGKRFTQKTRRGTNIIDVLLNYKNKLKNSEIWPEFKTIYNYNLYLYLYFPSLVLLWIIISILLTGLLIYIQFAILIYILIVMLVIFLFYVFPPTKTGILLIWTFFEFNITLVNSLRMYRKGERFKIWEK